MNWEAGVKRQTERERNDCDAAYARLMEGTMKAKEISGDPVDVGYTLVGEIDQADSYEFDIFRVWKDGEGRVFYDTDSGCSCPEPFEDGYELKRLFSREGMRKKITEWQHEYGYGNASLEKITALLDKAFPKK